MTEELLPKEGEQGRQLEILDLKNHGALYSHFLRASLPGAGIDNIKLDFELTEASLEGRNYNPVCEKSSIAERKKQWEGKEFSDAYSQWRTEFTGFMTGITDWKRESSLRVIMPNLKKAKDFTEGDADQLFNDFCKDGSNINDFIKRVTTNLASSSSKKISPEYLKDRLDDLRWIVSGLFGKETASNVVTRLIELESAIHNNSKGVVEFFNLDENKKRVNMLTDHEREILGALLKGEIPTLTPQATGGPTQESGVPVPTVLTVSAPAEGVSPKPAPVPPDEKALPEDKGKKEPSSPAPVIGQVPETPPARPIVGQNDVSVDSGQPERHELASEEDIYWTGAKFEDIKSADIFEELKEILERNKGKFSITVRASPEQVKEIVTSLAKDYRVQTEEISVDEFGKEITIKGVEIKKGLGKVTGKVTFDLFITNTKNPNNPYNGITARVQNYKANLLAKAFGGDVKAQIENIDSTVKDELDKQIDPSRVTEGLYIWKGKLLITFRDREIYLGDIRL